MVCNRHIPGNRQGIHGQAHNRRRQHQPAISSRFLAQDSGCREFVPACRVEAVDTTGAGDAFNGAFAVSLMCGNSPLHAARFASAVAAISVTRKGAQDLSAGRGAS